MVTSNIGNVVSKNDVRLVDFGVVVNWCNHRNCCSIVNVSSVDVNNGTYCCCCHLGSDVGQRLNTTIRRNILGTGKGGTVCQ